MNKFFFGIMVGAIIVWAVSHIWLNDVEVGLDTLVLDYEEHLTACEDAWQADLALCQMEIAECQEQIRDIPVLLVESSSLINKYKGELDKCHTYLEMCPD